jgi:hypothetical protein
MIWFSLECNDLNVKNFLKGSPPKGAEGNICKVA